MPEKSDKKADREVVIVLGMHRSGTSALSGVLSILGCDLPRHQMMVTTANEAGYFESSKIQVLHNHLLASAGSSWADWTEFSPSWMESPRATEYHDRAIKLLDEEFGTSPLFVLKDPRICRLFPFWRNVLEKAGCDIKVVLTHRNPLDVAASLEKRDGMCPELSVLIWLRHVLDAEASSRDLPRIFTSYQQLMDDWSTMADRFQESLGVTFPRRSAAATREVTDFLDQSLRHSNTSPEEVSRNPLMSDWVRSVFEILERWSRQGEDPTDHATLDTIRGDFNSTLPAFVHVIERLRQTTSERKLEVEKLHEEISYATSELTKERTNANSAHLQLAAVEADLARERTRAGDAVRKSQAQTDELARLTKGIIAQNRDLECSRIETAEIRANLAEHKRHLATARDEVLALRSSTSWRVTAPLRSVSLLLRRR